MRLRALLTAAGLLSSPFVIGAPAAEAVEAAPAGKAVRCSLQTAPRLAITSPHRTIAATLASDCAAPPSVTHAAWQAVHPREVLGPVEFVDSVRTATWPLFDMHPVGRTTWQGRGAFIGETARVPQNTAYTDVRYGSRAGIVATRSGSKVTVTSNAIRYTPATERFVPWNGTVGQLQWRAPGSTTWRALKQFTTNSAGKYTFVYTQPALRHYRVVFPATGAIWGAVSYPVSKRGHCCPPK